MTLPFHIDISNLRRPRVSNVPKAKLSIIYIYIYIYIGRVHNMGVPEVFDEYANLKPNDTVLKQSEFCYRLL